jgi:uncharacterized protein (TIGR01777 family)
LPLYERQSLIEAPVEEVFQWHTRPGALERLTPSWEKVKVISAEGGIQNGGQTVLEMQTGPFKRQWTALHRDYVEGKQFRDEQIKGPFAEWVHTHLFTAQTSDTSFMKDHVEYERPFGANTGVLREWLDRKIDRLFRFRHQRLQNDLKRLQPLKSAPKKIIITGASGLIGSALSAFLSAGGHEVRHLVRRKPRPGSSEIFWDYPDSKIDHPALEGADAVIHLAGENISSGRWSAEHKNAIRHSRVDGTSFLADALAHLKNPPKVLLAASAIGFYGSRDNEILTEQSMQGSGFLVDVCSEWERVCEPARQAGIRVVNVRTGIVLSAGGGALPQMMRPFSMGLGGVIGRGDQWMSWISLEDLVGIYHYLLHREDLSGPVNATAPGMTTNSDFTRVLGLVLKRNTPFHVPDFVIKTLLGQMGQELLLEGQRVRPAKLVTSGFEFLHSDLESALRFELGKFK